jgi:hypothetical protein
LPKGKIAATPKSIAEQQSFTAENAEIAEKAIHFGGSQRYRISRATLMRSLFGNAHRPSRN